MRSTLQNLSTTELVAKRVTILKISLRIEVLAMKWKFGEKVKIWLLNC